MLATDTNIQTKVSPVEALHAATACYRGVKAFLVGKADHDRMQVKTLHYRFTNAYAPSVNLTENEKRELLVLREHFPAYFERVIAREPIIDIEATRSHLELAIKWTCRWADYERNVAMQTTNDLRRRENFEAIAKDMSETSSRLSKILRALNAS